MNNEKVGGQEIPGVTDRLGLGVQNEAEQRLTVLPREYTGHSKNPIHQYKRQLYTRTSPAGQYRNQTNDIPCSQRWRSTIKSAKTRPGADCGSDHEHLIAKFRLKSKKVGKTTRPFRNDPNEMPYEYTVKVTNRFKELDVIDRVPEELWTEVCNTVQEAVMAIIPKKKKSKKAKWLSEEVFQIAEKRREAKGKREKERYIHLNAECQRIARRDMKAFLSDQCKEIEETIE